MFSFSNNDSYFVDLTRACAAKMMDFLEVWKHHGTREERVGFLEMTLYLVFYK